MRASRAANCSFSSRNWLRREIRPLAPCRGPDDERAVGLAEVAGKGHEVSHGMRPLAPASCKAWSSVSTIQVRPSSRATSGAYCGSVSTKRSHGPRRPAAR